MRQERLKRQIELGIVPAGTKLAERMWFIPDPVVLAPASRAILGKKMELYAGMVENLDHHVGRLVDHLKQIGEYKINDNLNFTVGYKSTFNSSSPGDLRMDGFMISLVYGWHPLIEGMKRLKNE